MCFRRLMSLAIVLGLTFGLSPQKLAADDVQELRRQQVARAVSFLRESQGDEGHWTSPTAPGVSALVTYALLESGVKPEDPTVARALRHLESFIQKDGGIYHPGTTHRNYETCIVLQAFAAANDNGKYTDAIGRATAFLKGLQWDQGEGLESTDTAFGGAGYGSHERPDLSNTTFLIEALKTAGVKSDDPAMQKALVFVSRCQNLESVHNTTEFATKVNDGGFYYTPAAGGTSQAGLTADGGLRSYASMTYAGLKSMIYAGLEAEDPRVIAASKWIRDHYTLDNNPGLEQQGLFYYFHTFAKTLEVLGWETVEDAQGVKHDWRAELIAKLGTLQNDDGSWLNRTSRWYEGDPNLVTAYALLALAHCEK